MANFEFSRYLRLKWRCHWYYTLNLKVKIQQIFLGRQHFLIKGPLARFWGGVFQIFVNRRIVVFHGFISAISGERIEDVLPPKNLWNSGVMVIKTAFLFQLLAFLVKKVKNEQVVMINVTICRKGRSFFGESLGMSSDFF